MRRACDAQTCPSLVHGSDTYVGGALASRNEGALLSLVTKTTVYDCHGNPAYMFQTGGVFDTVINKVTYQSSFQMFALDGTQLAYVKGTTFAVDNIALYDMNNVQVATLYRDTLSLSWVWGGCARLARRGLARAHRDRRLRGIQPEPERERHLQQLLLGRRVRLPRGRVPAGAPRCLRGAGLVAEAAGSGAVLEPHAQHRAAGAVCNDVKQFSPSDITSEVVVVAAL